MLDNLQEGDDDRRARAQRPQLPASPTRKKSYWLPILLLGGGAGLCMLGVCGAVVGYLVFGVKTTTDPNQIRVALDGMTDVQLPVGLSPHTKSLQITGVEDVEFQSQSKQSYLIIKTGPRFQLRHMGTLRESRDRGKIAGGGQPESPAEERTIKATVRGLPAEFIYRRYSGTETISGYFQGKQQPIQLEAELSLREFRPGTAVELAESIR